MSFYQECGWHKTKEQDLLDIHYLMNLIHNKIDDKIMLLDLEGNFFKVVTGYGNDKDLYKIILTELSFIIFNGTTISKKYTTTIKRNNNIELNEKEKETIKYCTDNFHGLTFNICETNGVSAYEAYVEFYKAQQKYKYILVKGTQFEQIFINKYANIQGEFMNIPLNKYIIDIQKFGVQKIEKCIVCKNHSGCGLHAIKHHCSMSDVTCFYNQLLHLFGIF